MNLTVKRITSDSTTTLSLIELDGQFICFGLENAHHDTKIAGKTRIPAGRYRVTTRTIGTKHSKYQHKFNAEHQGMLWVRDVPQFKYILIHIGNTAKDTAGCLLVGAGAKVQPTISITHSTLAYRKLYKKVIKAAQADKLTIEYLDLDHV